MLKRIKIRGKLLLLLTVPLIAVLIFATSGVIDRTDVVDQKDREARLAQVADAGADLSVALQVEGFESILSARLLLTPTEVRPDQVATDAALLRWSETVENVLPDITDPDLAAEFISMRALMQENLTDSRFELPADVLGEQLDSQTTRLTAINVALSREAIDLGLFRALDTFVQLTEIQESVTRIAFIGSSAVQDGRLGVASPALIEAEVRSISANVDSLRVSADERYIELLGSLQTDRFLPAFATDGGLSRTEGFVPAVDILEAVYEGNVVGGVSWIEASENRLIAINDVIDVVLRDANTAAVFASVQADGEARSFLILAGSVIVFTLLMALLIGRSVSRPLIDLTHGAEQLSTEELPAMVESMRSGGRNTAPMMSPIQAKGRDEIAQLARAFSEIQAVTVEVAEEQGELLRRGISDIFVNLARRNQSLLDRQIEFIDQLESSEENPDQLENLFRLDHLATRMRRNAESLLVLAGAEPSRRRGRPIELTDVIRVAMGEIEDFARIQLMTIDSATVAGSVAVDLAHLLSELMENSTQFSPPETAVEVVGRLSGDGSYQLTLSDRGIGMSAEQIDTANQTLNEAPIIGLDISRSLGFTVVSRLANRLGVSVRLADSPDGGVIALITVPAEMVGPEDSEDSGEEAAPSAKVAPPSQVALPVQVAPPSSWAATAEPITITAVDEWSSPLVAPAVDDLAALPLRRPPAPVVEDAPMVASEPLPLRTEATPDADLFEVFKPVDPVPAPPSDSGSDIFATLDLPVGPQAPAPDNPATPARHAAEVGAVDQNVTSAGLIRRTPRHVEVPERSKYAAATDTAPAAIPANRSPEEVREMLSRYRAGLRKGRGPAKGGTDQKRPNRGTT